MAVLNAYILYKKSGGRQSRLNFILKLVDRIVEKYNHEKAQIRKGRRSHTDTPLRLTACHFPSYLPSTPKRKHPGRRCQVCAAKGMRKESIYFCRECDMPLCVVPCFEIYHTVSKYWFPEFVWFLLFVYFVDRCFACFFSLYCTRVFPTFSISVRWAI